MVKEDFGLINLWILGRDFVPTSSGGVHYGV